MSNNWGALQFGIDFFSSAKSRTLKNDLVLNFVEKKICNLNNKLREKKGVAKNKHAEALRSEFFSPAKSRTLKIII